MNSTDKEKTLIWEKTLNFINSSKPGERVLIDCGANDGCSALKYLLMYPKSKILSFEPNPSFRNYNMLLPNLFINAAVGTEFGYCDLILDTIDGDGSTINIKKNIDYYGKLNNEIFPTIKVPVVDLVEILKIADKKSLILDLKMDIEGAEYMILDKIFNANLTLNLNNIFIEFHWNKIGMLSNEQYQYEQKLNEFLGKKHIEWDAADLMIFHLKGRKKIKKLINRFYLLFKIYLRRFYMNVNFIKPLQ